MRITHLFQYAIVISAVTLATDVGFCQPVTTAERSAAAQIVAEEFIEKISDAMSGRNRPRPTIVSIDERNRAHRNEGVSVVISMHDSANMQARLICDLVRGNMVILNYTFACQWDRRENHKSHATALAQIRAYLLAMDTIWNLPDRMRGDSAKLLDQAVPSIAKVGGYHVYHIDDTNYSLAASGNRLLFTITPNATSYYKRFK